MRIRRVNPAEHGGAADRPLPNNSKFSKYFKEVDSMRDYGPYPLVINIEKAAEVNNNFRSTLWTGDYLQVTLMKIKAGGDIGVELHPDTDQFLQIVQGQGIVMMGSSKDKMNFEKKIYENYSILIPAGTWHNLINTGHTAMKLFSVYAPPHHPHGTVHITQQDALEAEEQHQ